MYKERSYNSAQMRALALASLLLSLGQFSYGSSGADDAFNMVQTAVEQVDLRGNDARSFQMEVDFRVQFDVSQKGHLSLKWAAKDLWYQQVRIDTYQEIRVRNGGNLWISRNIRFTPLRVFEIEDLLRVLPPIPKKSIRGLKYEELDGVRANCIDLRPNENAESRSAKRRICIDLATNDVLSDEEREGVDLRIRKFVDYQSSGTHRYPRKLNLYVNGSPIIEATLTALQETSLDARWFQRPQNAILRPQCDDLITPKPVKAPRPQYRQATASSVGGTIVATLTIEPDGSIDNIFLIESAGRERDAMVREMLNQWKFQPARCGDRAIPYDAQVEVNFPAAGTNPDFSPSQQVARVRFHN